MPPPPPPSSGISLRTVLLALPTLYLVFALVFANGRSPRLPNFQPTRIIYMNPGPAAAPGPAVHAISDHTAAAYKPPQPAPPPPPVAPAVAVEAPRAIGGADASPPPPKPDVADTMSVKFYDGNTVTVYPHLDRGQSGANWWPSVEREGRGAAAAPLP